MMEDEKLELITEDADDMAVAREMAIKISKMYEDRDEKAFGAKKHLIAQLDVMSEKYRTANGVMSALEVLRDIGKDATPAVLSMAKSLAKSMSLVVHDMADKASKLEPDEIDGLCEGFYDGDFVDSKGIETGELALELLRLQLCQNVGPNAQDIADFIDHADLEIEKARDELRTFCYDHGIDFNELCGPHENCHDCLCDSCVKDCKEGKIIKDGQSAYDVCQDFVEIEF